MAPLTFHLFEHAPPELRALSQNGGDEDFVIVIPAEHVASWDVDDRIWVDGTPAEPALLPSFHTWRVTYAVEGAAVSGPPDWYRLDNGDAVAIVSHA